MADNNFEKAREEWEKMQKNSALMLKTQQDLEKGIGQYAKVLNDILKIQNDIHK